MAPLQIYDEASLNLREALQAANCSFCTIGEIPLQPKSPLTLLFKDNDGNGGVLELPPVSQDDILPLLEACKQAPFGRGSETVLDPTYRRALVLPAEKFAVSPAAVVDPYTIGILDEISRHLLNRSDRRIIARLDKMNVYGPGDFFKGHIDTPKSSDMFGTLLINLPVPHEGGELVVFATNAKDSEPDAGDTESSAHVAQGKVSAGSGPEMKHTTTWGATDCLSWIAFFSDCPHEVLPVKSGHRVTLSFDLIYDGREVNNEGDQLKLEIIDRLASALTTDVVLNATSPFFGTHLQHRYPVSINDGPARHVTKHLKGIDEILYRAFLQINATITFHYQYPGFILPEDKTINPRDAFEFIPSELDGALPGRLGVPMLLADPGYEIAGSLFQYVSYGNEASDATGYALIVMIASLPGHPISKDWPAWSDEEVWGTEGGDGEDVGDIGHVGDAGEVGPAGASGEVGMEPFDDILDFE